MMYVTHGLQSIFCGRWFLAIIFLMMLSESLVSCSSDPGVVSQENSGEFNASQSIEGESAEDFLVVDCLLPGQIRRLGTQVTYVTPRQPIKATSEDCAIRGGEYVAEDRANYKTALKVWMTSAEKGEPDAQYYVGVIYEKGLGRAANYKSAANWYRKAAEQGHRKAAINLGRLYEKGLGLQEDATRARKFYVQASGNRSPSLPHLLLQDPLEEKEARVVSGEPQKRSQQAEWLPTKSTDPGKKDQGPVIELIDPPILKTRGVRVAQSRSIVLVKGNEQRRLRGRVLAPAGLASFTMNKEAVPVGKNWVFEASLPQIGARSKGISVDLVARDTQGRVGEARLFVTHKEAAKSVQVPQKNLRPSGFGAYHALVIGNDHYKFWSPLDNAIADATDIAQVLRDRYGFSVQVLQDASRSQVLKALNEYRKNLTEEDNLLLYYAGHGYLEPNIDRGYWIPVEGELDDNSEWILLPTITDLLQLIPAKHVMVVADSCYSGKLTRTTLAKIRPGIPEKTRELVLQDLAKKRVRTALTSGGVEPVLDIGKGGHSVFANAFLGLLQENDEVLEAERLFWAVRGRVVEVSKKLNFEQIPTYSPIQFAGHESLGDFIFVPQKS